jgi:hypothetical protein
MEGPGLHYVRRTYRKMAEQVAQGDMKMLTRQTPEAQQVCPGQGPAEPKPARLWSFTK